MDNRNIIYYIIIISIIIFIIHSIYSKNNYITEVKKNNKKTYNNESESIQHADISVPRKDYRFIDYDEKLPWNWDSESRPCPIVENNENHQNADITIVDYLKGITGDVRETCPPIQQSPNNFFDDFYGFRDKVYHSSTMHVDPVDKMNQLILSGGLGNLDRSNVKIRDLYDSLATGVDLYSIKGVRQASYDNINYDGYKMIPGGVTGLNLVQDQWVYPNDREMNSGVLYNGFLKDGYTSANETQQFSTPMSADMILGR